MRGIAVGQREIEGPTGRLDVIISGPPGGQTLITHHGTPSAGITYEPLVAIGAARGVRHVAYSRPGYAGSERALGRSVGDCAADVAAIADALGIERFYTLGSSGGGPHAIACAVLLPDRVIAAASIAGVAPCTAAGLDWHAGMAAGNVEEFDAARAGAEPLRAMLEAELPEIIAATGDTIHATLRDLLCDVDRSALTGKYADHLAELGRVGLARGLGGWIDDDLAFVRDWEVDLDRLERPVTIWQGGQDRFVPEGHGRWLADHLPGARARLLPEHGHLSLALAHYDEVLADLLGTSG